jgi:hypothetical protein
MYQEIDQNDIANAVDACKNKGGVFHIEEHFTGDTVVTCKNAKIVNIDKWAIADVAGDQK